MNFAGRKYYVSSFFWGTLSKLIVAVVNFISVPLLLKAYGNADYGILSLAQAANAYILLLDLGMNTGAVKFFSEWRTEGKQELINQAARSNITFYIFIGILNSVILIMLSVFGKKIFGVTESQFLLLQKCLLITALFSVSNWMSAAFSQLLISAENVAFVNKMQCITASLNIVTVYSAVRLNLSIECYFFLTILISSFLLIPYAIGTVKLKLVDSIFPTWNWKYFKMILLYSLNIFVLSIFQMTASNSRPIILGIFSMDAASILSEYKILSVFPTFIIMIMGTLSTALLPKSSKALASGNENAKTNIAYKGTFLASVLANILCTPFIFCANEVIHAYVGKSYSHLSIPLVIWLLSILYQMHSTPCNSLILATGKTIHIVISTAAACVLSVALNIAFCPFLGIFAAVISYGLYVLIVITAYYVFYYKNILKVSGLKVFKSFFIPTTISFISLFIARFFPFDVFTFLAEENRWKLVAKCLIKTFVWGAIYCTSMCGFIFIRRKINGTK